MHSSLLRVILFLWDGVLEKLLPGLGPGEVTAVPTAMVRMRPKARHRRLRVFFTPRGAARAQARGVRSDLL